ncbi:beta-carotene 15,15'-dioxygenase, Brp/Blh family [Flavobacterium sp. F372]|uniref:Probable beta-carotene 15,15'-dioxygenase n=1 Tax=Flavobacterium bernardetii TaxID=2813823 RepID=A0ABR7IVI7_9FLAO|nr:Brp/Blh family beta-carotene 15,15'-dioxygenase [Flavobacterium bernardetii]MBC5833774.1 Brp/Blh family beta-carotene 15,15'-dioxygenase [Flavobacterium bernardetii]NHF69007.1 beta-carotene 15,15'-dioxygenase, Brp/Blh family [Flavobacterium bernardetii]
MNNYPSIAIVLSFLGLWITSFFSNDLQVGIGFVLILSFGILHGANDILISKSIMNRKNQLSKMKIIYLYITVVIFGAVLFYFLPVITLLLFVIISGYHFGEQQLDYLKGELLQYNFVFKTLYGLLVLFLLFGFHINDVIAVVYEITSYSIDEFLIINTLYLILILFTMNYIFVFKKLKVNQSIFLNELFYLLIFAIIFKVSSLIWGFTIYFIVWHSMPSIINQTKFLYGSFNYFTFMKYIKEALFYWVVSLIGLFLFYFLFQDIKLFNTLFFSFLAAITFPHVVVVLMMLKDKSGQ